MVRGEAPEFSGEASNAGDNSDSKATAVGLMNREIESMVMEGEDTPILRGMAFFFEGIRNSSGWFGIPSFLSVESGTPFTVTPLPDL